jgi:hypothetical protein
MRPRSVRRSPSVTRTAAALLAFALLGAAASGAEGAAPRRALLLRGADAVIGLPFFLPNAIAALSGAYALDSPASSGASSPASKAGSEVAVWYTREPLVFAPEWKRVEQGAAGTTGGVVAHSLARADGAVLAVKTGKYALFFELPAGGPAPGASGDSRFAAFAKAFEEKFQAFFVDAASDAELSFPAYVDY